MVFMNHYDGESKLESLVDALASCDRRRSYCVSIATCYCTPTSVRNLIDAVLDRLKLIEVHLYIDRRTAISIGHAELSELENAYPDLLSIFAVKTGRLFHTKGYCLAAYSPAGDLVHGRLAIGSANLTSAGLTGTHGNIESLAIHSDINTISEFLEFFDSEGILVTLDDLGDFSPDDTTDFQFALLTSGLFSHKWSATLATYLSVRFRLNEEGRQRAQEGIDTPGFDMDRASIAKPYFEFDRQNWQPNDTDLVRNFGIECFLGHWIPKSVIQDDEEHNERFQEFKTALFENVDSRMAAIRGEILHDFASLTQEGIVDPPETDPAQGLHDRIERLRNDQDQLYRIWSGRQFFQFPYDLSDGRAIEETFDDLLRTAHGKTRKNRSMRAFLSAERDRTLEPLQALHVVDR